MLWGNILFWIAEFSQSLGFNQCIHERSKFYPCWWLLERVSCGLGILTRTRWTKLRLSFRIRDPWHFLPCFSLCHDLGMSVRSSGICQVFWPNMQNLPQQQFSFVFVLLFLIFFCLFISLWPLFLLIIASVQHPVVHPSLFAICSFLPLHVMDSFA